MKLLFSNRISPSRLSYALALSGACLIVSACGGGSGGVGTGSQGSVGAKDLATGTVTGFGSVIVEGVKFDDNSAKVLIEDDPANPSAGSSSDITLGAQVEVESKNSSASQVVVRSEVIGKVTSLATDGFVVAGVQIKVSSDPANPTVFDGLAGLSQVAVSDFVEVHGQRDASDNLVATRIEKRDASGLAITKVSGNMSALNTTAKTFVLSGLTVNYANATRVLPSADALANGKRVAVYSEAAVTANVLAAKSVVVRGTPASSGDVARVGGRIRALDFAAKSFVLDGVTVDTTAATFVNGTANDLANGRKVRVLGTFTDSKLVASEVRYVKDQGDALVDLSGGITDFVSTSSFKLRGVPINASGNGISFSGGSTANLADNVIVRIKGSVDGNVVKPSEIIFADSATTPGLGERAFAGSVSNYSATPGTFTLMNLGMTLLASTEFKNSDGSKATVADFGNGDTVKVQGSFVGGVFEVREAKFMSGPGLVIDKVEGLVYEFDASTSRFKINGQVVKFSGSTQIEGSLTNLRNGTKVEIKGTLVAGELQASKLQIKPPKR